MLKDVLFSSKLKHIIKTLTRLGLSQLCPYYKTCPLSPNITITIILPSPSSFVPHCMSIILSIYLSLSTVSSSLFWHRGHQTARVLVLFQFPLFLCPLLNLNSQVFTCTTPPNTEARLSEEPPADLYILYSFIKCCMFLWGGGVG